jgi:hypothetical protein
MRTLSSVIGSLLLVGLALPSMAEVNPSARAKCMGKMHYPSVSEVQIIREYQQDRAYHLRLNASVVTVFGQPARVGFDCTVNLDTGKVVGIPELTPYPPEEEAVPSIAKLPERRLRFGGTGCPDLQAWKNYVDEIERRNYKYYPRSCRIIEEGTRIFGPSETEKYKNTVLIHIYLPDGTGFWVEESNL